MKNLTFFIAFIPVIGFSQIDSFEVSGGDMERKKKDWYKRTHDKNESKKEFFAFAYGDIQDKEFVMAPELYSDKDSNVVSIEFIQDANHFRKDYTLRKSSITNLEKSYSIGLVKDFMIDESHVGVFIKTTYADGAIKTSYVKMHLDYAIMYYSRGFEVLVLTQPIYVYEHEDIE